MTEALLIVCPHCHAPNRFPQQRLADGGRCGQCKSALFVGAPLELDEASFERHVERSGIPLVVDFWAPWCGPCRMMAPAFAQAAGRLEPRVRLAKLDTERYPALAQRFGIRSIPTLVVFRDGHEIARQPGAMDLANIERWVGAAIQG